MNKLSSYYTLDKKILINLVMAGQNLVYVIVNSSLMKFYTDIVGLSPSLYATAYLVFSVWNGLNDPIIGYWADKRPFRTGVGKYRPLVVWAIPVIGVMLSGVFLASPGWDKTLTFVYLLVLLVVYEGAQTVLGVSFTAFTVNTFISMEERAKVQVISSYVSQIPVFLGGMIPVWFLTGDFSRSTIVLVFVGCVALGLLLCLVGSRFMREDAEFYERVESTRNLRDIMKLSGSLFRDKSFIVFVLAFFLVQAGTGNYFSGYLYYMDNVLEVSGLKATLPDVLTGVGQMLTFPLILLAVKRFGSRDTLWPGLLLAAAGHLVLSFHTNYWIVAATYILILVGYGFGSALNTPIQGMMVDHIELRTGLRQPGLVRGIMAILLVPAASVQPLILSGFLQASGYDGTSKHQGAAVADAIRLGTGLVPALIIVAGVVLLRLLPFDHRAEREIREAMEARHRHQEVLPPLSPTPAGDGATATG